MGNKERIKRSSTGSPITTEERTKTRTQTTEERRKTCTQTTEER